MINLVDKRKRLYEQKLGSELELNKVFNKYLI